MRFLRLLTVFFRLNISFCFIFRFCIYFYICVLWIFFILIINIFFVHTFAQFHIVLWKLTGLNCLCLALDIDLISSQSCCQSCILSFFTDCKGKLIIRYNNACFLLIRISHNRNTDSSPCRKGSRAAAVSYFFLKIYTLLINSAEDVL